MRLESLENCLRAEGHWADRNEKDIVAVEERIDRLEKEFSEINKKLSGEGSAVQRCSSASGGCDVAKGVADKHFPQKEHKKGER